MKHVDKVCFVSTVFTTVENDKSIKTALDSPKRNDSCIKVRPHADYGRIVESNSGGNDKRRNEKTEDHSFKKDFTDQPACPKYPELCTNAKRVTNQKQTEHSRKTET